MSAPTAAARMLAVLLAAGAAGGGTAALPGGWDDRFHLRGMDGSVFALAWDGSSLYAGGDFWRAGGVPASNIARWDGASWRPLGNGVGGVVYALAWDGSSLYAGGDFGFTPAKGIVRWDGSSWSPLGGGVAGVVYALAWDGSSLYAGGDFTGAGGVLASGIARWDGLSWSPLGSGVDRTVYAVEWDGSSLYAGGSFGTAGGVTASGIARWDRSSWSQLGGGVDGVVTAVEWDGSSLYAGGYFTAAGGVPASCIARWDGASWSALGSGMETLTYPGVSALAWDGSSLYAGGSFGTAGGVPAGCVARWGGVGWRALSSSGEGMNHVVSDLAWDGSSLYAAGGFTAAGGVAARGIARWDGSSWSPLDSGVDGVVTVVAWDGSSLYAGGYFTAAGGVPASCIARWDGASWSALGSGMGAVTYPGVSALAWDGSSLYAGGSFGAAGGAPASCIARWDGASWSPLGSGVQGASVYALEWDGSSLYAGGSFGAAGGVLASCIARWDGASWSPLGSGMDGMFPDVYALEWDGSSLYAGGWFTTAGGVLTSGIARWDGSSWSPLGSGMGYGGALYPSVHALEWDGSSLYAGGDFTRAGGVPASGIARWDGASWNPLGTGVDGESPNVYALAWDGSSLYAGGAFRTAGGKSSVNIGRYTCASIAISPATLPPATTGSAYSTTLMAAGGTSPYRFKITGGAPAPGLALSAAGILSGTPTTPGVYAFTVEARDADDCRGSVGLVLLVNAPGCAAITIMPPALPDARQGAPYAQTLSAAGGVAPYAFSIAAGALPPGLGLQPTGALTGIPAASGTFTFTAAARDAAGCIGIRGYVLVAGSGRGNVVAGAGLGPSSPNRVRVFIGDVGADARGVEQMATGPGPGPVLGPHVRAFLREGPPVAKVSYHAYGTLRYGVNPATGRLDGDGFDEILTGAGTGAVFGPHVRGWNHDGVALTAVSKVSYFAYGTLKYGVYVHRGEVDGDGFAELLTGPGPGPVFGPQVRGFNYDGTMVTAIAKINFEAFVSAGHGVSVAGGGVDGDGFDEIACATGPGPALTPDFRGFDFDASRIAPLPGFVVTLSSSTRHGGRVGLGDVTGDTVRELLAGKGRDPGADARVSPFAYDAAGSLLVSWPTFDAFPGESYGVNPAGAEMGY